MSSSTDAATPGGPIRESAPGDDSSPGASVRAGCPSWLAAGARALDTATGRTGVVQFLQSEDREVCTSSSQHAKRARLRSVDSTRPGWWAEVGSLRWNMP
ncbi:hypothetical protein [Streptomyces sulfonofaciens]|uniref:hypothetical protein n=1 Tax=Streptomyces sulfonofaciens TaxID=68272 RepID=UPI0016756A02|nr:hypothetical protein [Streptomyces sulfonofaciens]